MGNKTQFQFYLLKIKQKKVCYLDLVSNVLGVSHALLHLTEKKNIYIYIYTHTHIHTSSLQTVIAAMKLKDTYSLEGKL